MRRYIYLTENLINGKKYIGQRNTSKSEEDDKYLGSGVLMLKALEKYGHRNFKKTIIEYVDSQDEANQREKYFIKFYNAVESDDFYNIDEGGKGGHERSEVLTSTKDKLSSAAKGRKIMNNGVNIKHVIPEEIESHLLNGWEFGYPDWYKENRKTLNKELAKKRNSNEEWRNSISNTLRQQCWVTDGVNDYKILKTSIDDFLSKGFWRGRSNGGRNK